jgi:PAS domain S-box-containing protein
MNGHNSVSQQRDYSYELEYFNKNHLEVFNNLIKNSFDMMVLMDEKGYQNFVSASSEQILGFKPHELMNIPVIDEMIHPADRANVRKAFNQIIQKGTHGGTQYRHLHKNGHWVYLESFGNNLLNDPVIKSVVLNVRDITDRKLAEDKLIENGKHLRELIATKDRFISIIGHDIKNPFSTIIGFSDLLLEDIRDNNYEDIEKYAQIIKDSSLKLNELLTNLLTWSKTQSKRISFKPEEFILEHIISDVKNLLNDTASKKSINIKLSKAGEHMIMADLNMVQTIMRNLISNGIKFTPEGGSVSVHISTGNQKIIIAVTDTGVGIKKEKLDKLFQIESMKTTTGTGGEKGTGLGLLLVKEFVELHDGKVWAEQNATRGMTFKVALPYQ